MSQVVPPRKQRKPRPKGKGEPIHVRLQPTPLTALDAYIATQPEPRPSRPEMVRKILEDRLVHEGLIPPGEGVGTRT